VQVTLELFLESVKQIWYTCQSRWSHRANQEPHSWANGFFKIEGFAGKCSLPCLTIPCFVDFFALAPIYTWPECGKALCTGRLATQAKLPRETTTWTFDSHVLRSCSLKLLQICEPARVKQTISSHFFSIFWVGRYNKTLNDWSREKQWVLFPLDLNVPRGEAEGNIEGLGKTKLTVSLGASHQVLNILDSFKSNSLFSSCI